MEYIEGVCDCYVRVFNDPENQYEIVYCHLHKAAPDMYEALNKLIGKYGVDCSTANIEKARQALAKGRG